MSIVLAFVGVILIVVVMLDQVVTTLTMEGAGPVSRPVSHILWRCLRIAGITRHPRLSLISGPATLLGIILFWIICLWAGWVLIFCWQGITLVNAQTSVPAAMTERIYYAGYTITTIGYGDLRALNTPGRIASVAAGFNGLFLLSLAITYSIQVLTAVVENRRLALMINVLINHRVVQPSDEQRAQLLDFMCSRLGSLDMAIAGAAQKYLAYPVIRFFSERSEQVCLSLNVYRLYRYLAGLSADQDQLPAPMAVQTENTCALLRTLVLNATADRWPLTSPDKHGQAARPMASKRSNSSRDQSFEKRLNAYVDANYWRGHSDTRR